MRRSEADDLRTVTRASTPAVLTWLVALLLLAGAGCGTRGAEAEDEGLITLASTESTGGVANRSGVPTTGGLAADDGDDDDEREDKDYWAPIPFDRTNFEEVRQQVKKRYIDPNVDEGWAYAEAATWALASSDKDGRLLLPEAFYKIRKDNPEEKGSLKGAVSKLHPNDGFVILDEVKDKPEEEKKRLSDDEIRTLRAQQQARARLLREEWHKVGFGAKDFDRVMAFIKKEYKATPEWTVKTAWIAAAQGYLYSLDPHSSLMPKSAWDDSNDKTTDSSFDGIGAMSCNPAIGGLGKEADCILMAAARRDPDAAPRLGLHDRREPDAGAAGREGGAPGGRRDHQGRRQGHQGRVALEGRVADPREARDACGAHHHARGGARAAHVRDRAADVSAARAGGAADAGRAPRNRN